MCTMHNCTTALGNTASMASGKPLSPSTQAMKMSCTPRLRSSVTTCSQNLAPSVWASHRPSTSFSPAMVMPMAILRHFTKKNVQHPTYKAFAELGKAIKTIFLCRYLHDEALRREINEGLNVVEQWNGATDFVFFARR